MFTSKIVFGSKNDSEQNSRIIMTTISVGKEFLFYYFINFVSIKNRKFYN